MSDAVDRGITVTEMAPMHQPVEVLPETTAAFVGRALRGPVNSPVLITSFGEYRRRFGDIWSRSSLGPAVQQFFAHGGKRVYIVRVANNARGALLCLPASGSALVLRAREPGSAELIRAAIDFDGIDDENDVLFNLTLQRVDPDTGLVIDQEIFRHADYREGAENCIADLLLTSTLACAEQPYPTHRPERTGGPDRPFNLPYVGHTQAGTDGHELSDYDLVGSIKAGTGLLALQQVERFDILYLPPPGKGRDLGPTSVLAAELLCRERGAMLVVDPQTDWVTPAKAVAGVRNAGLASPNMLSYFPRMNLRDDDNDGPRAVGGALAGLLCKLDRTYGPWYDVNEQGMGFNRNMSAAFDVGDEDSHTLSREGLNVIAKGSAGRAHVCGDVTLSRGSESHRKFASLSVRRFCLQVSNAIEQATRWAVFEVDDAHLAKRIRSQVIAYLSCLADLGAFEDDRLIVECDAGLCRRDDTLEHGVTILIVIRPRGCAEPVSFTLHQTIAGCRMTTTAFAPAMRDCA